MSVGKVRHSINDALREARLAAPTEAAIAFAWLIRHGVRSSVLIAQTFATMIASRRIDDKRVLGAHICELNSRMRSARLPPLNAIRAFAAAAKHASFSRAAGELGVTHGAISKQVRLLEDDLGRALFSRGVRQVKLTAAGRELIADVGPALERIGAAAAALRQVSSEPGQVRINARPSFALRWLIPHLPRFMRAFPDVEPQVITSTLDPVRLPPNSFDVVIRRAGATWPTELQQRPFLREGAFPVAAPDLLVERPISRAEDLAEHVLLQTATREKDWRDWLIRAKCPGLRPAGELWFEHQQFTLQAAIDGMGVALGLAVWAAPDLSAGRLALVFPRGPCLRLASYCVGVTPGASEAAREFAAWLLREGRHKE